jgi:hypothetical protein
MNKIILLPIVFALPLLLVGCYAPLIEGAQQSYDAARRVPLKTDAASSDDPIDQFKLGNTYCCKGGGPMDDLSIYDNVKATQWYCRAARQGYAPAQLQLARLYSGHAIRGLHVALRASALVGTTETDFSTALMWANLAANNKGEGDVEDAVELRNKITENTTDEERIRAANLIKNWQSAACQWTEVISLSKKIDK